VNDRLKSFASEERKIIDGLKKVLEAELLLARSQLLYLKKQSREHAHELPTLTTLPAVLVRAADEIFAIPQSGVTELLLVNVESPSSVETVNGHRVLRLPDRAIPLIDLEEMLGAHSPNHDNPEEQWIVVGQSGTSNFGLCVDEVLGPQTIDIKPVSGIFESLNTFAGATLLGDGRAVILLDLKDLVACQPSDSV
jgi:two-component system chemotaxis sensor kinase CheA